VPLVITDELLRSAGLTERQAAIEIACQLYAAGVLDIPQAMRLAGVSRSDFEAACLDRKVTVYRYTEEMLAEDMQTAQRLEGSRAGRL
jgi:predicted HTH domain antitoxin